MRILVVDDEMVALTSVKRLLRRRGFEDVTVCDTGQAAIELIRSETFDVVLLDLLMPDVDGLRVIEASKAFKPLTEFIMITAIEDVKMSVKAIRLGAYDYLVKPIDPERLYLSITRAFERRSFRAGLLPEEAGEPGQATPEAFSSVITRDARMKELMRYTHIVAQSSLPILITGASGTGKELFARAIHRAGSGPQSPFVPVNVAAVPETLFESQFFGHMPGAFTGATGPHNGYFMQANGGALYLDEVSEIPSTVQAKFLRALEDRTITRIGDNTPRSVDIRLISSTNVDLNAACRDGRFRLDLYYRLNAAHIHLPPLQERPGDIPLLTDHFIRLANQQYDKSVTDCDHQAREYLLRHPFPGNVRELKWMVEKAVLVCDGVRLSPRHFNIEHDPVAKIADDRRLLSLKENAEAHVAFVVEHCGFDNALAADILGVSPRQVQRRLSDMRSRPAWESWFAQWDKAGGKEAGPSE